MTQPNLISLYRERASARLESAGFMLRNNPAYQFVTTPDGDLARSNIGMTIWSAAIDVGSILLLQENGTVPSGRSPEISRFITRVLDQQHPELNLSLAWSILIQLHNIQHRAGHDRARFTMAATAARRSFAVLNHLLHAGHRIDAGAYSWLARVRDQYVNRFRDEPPTQWTSIEPEVLNRRFPGIGSVPLHWAAQNHDPNAVETLITAGAAVDTKDNTGQTPLHSAARSGPPETIYAFIRHGADIEDLANLGRPLHYAAGFNGYDTVEMLINSQANVNSRDANDETPLHWAARWQDDAEVPRLLIRAGARPTAQSFTGHSPHDIAVVSSSYFSDLLAI